MKIIDKIRKSRREGEVFYSFEYFPPRTQAGVENLYARMDRMGRLHPLFVDVTWGAGGSTAELTLDIVSHTQNLSGLETMMHLTCTNMPIQKLKDSLQQAYEDGIRNILALRGDPPRGQSSWETCENGLSYAIDLIKLIRETYGDKFGIGVAGYPGGHMENPSYEDDIRFLKEKVDAGADFILTQLFYDCDVFFKFVDDCRDIGITCPIIPGIMPIQSYKSFKKVTEFCRDVPQEITTTIEAIKNDDKAVKEYGFQLVLELCRDLIKGGVWGLHFYTMNLERTVTLLLKELDLIPEQISRTLPWRRSANEKRHSEDVRPIFWANRPRSYLARTMEWDEFPNGRWGDSRSPAFGELADQHWFRAVGQPKRYKKMWGESPESFQDVQSVFVNFCEGTINAIPWFDGPLASESTSINRNLIHLNQNGFLTINSQPRVNAALSSSPNVGWGPEGGFVYQKAYVEFFADEKRLRALLEVQKEFPNITFHAINRIEKSYSNCDTVNAVTWGVFPGKEILQPTVVDPESFVVWKDEAFELWMSSWASIYPKESRSYELLENLYNTLYLVNVVDNDFIQGDIWAFFNKVIAKYSSK